jgi:glycine/D-amino acid oxidase-like deaminating enzyme
MPDELRVAAAPLDGDVDVDVAIVGGGYTGLWTALYLAEADPALRIVVLEAEHLGHGASGRNGGWCSALLATGLTTLARRHGRDAAIAMQRAMQTTVDEVGKALAADGDDAGYTKGGTVSLARTAAQESRLVEHVDEARSFGFGPDDVRWLDTVEVEQHCHATSVRSALYTPHCAVIHPMRLVHAVAAAAARRGVRLHEHSPVLTIEPRQVTTSRGRVRAGVIVLATEAFTVDLPGHHRDVIPLYSLMIGSEPLTSRQWDQIGLDHRPTFNDARNLIIYGQRTADGRIAFGGRGAPYHYGSRIDPRFDRDERVRTMLVNAVRELFPVLDEVEFPYHWGGPLGVPRDWQCAVRYDRSSGLASAGGYVGDGVATTNLAGRTIADLITGRDSDLVRLPWVQHRLRRWEPEPLRWLGVNVARRAAAGADAAESRSGRVASWQARAWTRLLDALTGH